MGDLQEFLITCPWCWENYSTFLEAESSDVELIEDCQVCCHPIQLRLQTAMNGELNLSVDRAQ